MQLYIIRQKQRHHTDSDDNLSDTTVGETDRDDDRLSQGDDACKGQGHSKHEWRHRRQSVDFEAAVVRVTDNGGLLIEDANAADTRRFADDDSESVEMQRRTYRQFKRESRMSNGGDHGTATTQRRHGTYVKRSESTSSNKPNGVANRGVTGEHAARHRCFDHLPLRR
jgi:hypothetical protein